MSSEEQDILRILIATDNHLVNSFELAIKHDFYTSIVSIFNLNLSLLFAGCLGER